MYVDSQCFQFNSTSIHTQPCMYLTKHILSVLTIDKSPIYYIHFFPLCTLRRVKYILNYINDTQQIRFYGKNPTMFFQSNKRYTFKCINLLYKNSVKGDKCFYALMYAFAIWQTIALKKHIGKTHLPDQMCVSVEHR